MGTPLPLRFGAARREVRLHHREYMTEDATLHAVQEPLPPGLIGTTCTLRRKHSSFASAITGPCRLSRAARSICTGRLMPPGRKDAICRLLLPLSYSSNTAPTPGQVIPHGTGINLEAFRNGDDSNIDAQGLRQGKTMVVGGPGISLELPSTI